MMWWVIAGITALAVAALAAYLLNKRKNYPFNLPPIQTASGESSADSYKDSKSELEKLVRQQEEAKRQREQKRQQQAKIILEADPIIRDCGLSFAGFANLPAKDVSDTAKMVNELAKRLDDEQLEIMSRAATTKVLDLDLEKRTSRDPVSYPTRDIELEPMADLNQLMMMQPENLVEDDDKFYSKMATAEHLILQPYESIIDEKILYLLLDGSGSMEELMDNGVKRHVWARAVVIRLLAEAIRGGTLYYFRLFDNLPKDLHQATNPDEAEKLIRQIISSGFSSGGTSILNAVKKAVDDIRTKQGHFTLAEIVLITDGEDGSVTEPALRKMLGNDIRLHVILIGRRSEALEKVASSKKFY